MPELPPGAEPALDADLLASDWPAAARLAASIAAREARGQAVDRDRARLAELTARSAASGSTSW